jgi:prepilin-type N-terminal cleavage/methylation domain-containing protein
MRKYKYKLGLTLIEMVIVVGIIALLASMIISLVSRFDNQAKEKGLDCTFTLLEGALQEYYEFTDSFPEQPENDFSNAAVHSEYLYQELHSIPESRQMLEKINNSLIENKYGTPDTSPEIYDPWGTAFDYIYVAGDNFPQLISAGKDKTFGTNDDIRSGKIE